jgi:hypothetical protein
VGIVLVEHRVVIDPVVQRRVHRLRAHVLPDHAQGQLVARRYRFIALWLNRSRCSAK